MKTKYPNPKSTSTNVVPSELMAEAEKARTASMEALNEARNLSEADKDGHYQEDLDHRRCQMTELLQKILKYH